jgi:metallophosphoesterase superfamily enzyme
VAVVADVHLGYEWSRGRGGDVVPAHSLAETLERLGRLLDRAPEPVRRLIVAGDLVECPTVICPRTRRDVEALRGWLAGRGVALQAVRGNHDGPGPGFEAAVGVSGWTIVHGDQAEPGDGRPLVTGHVHPVLKVVGLRALCFVVGPSRIVLPAFTRNAAGWNVASGQLPGVAADTSLRCVVSAGDGMLDCGPLQELPSRLGRCEDAAGGASGAGGRARRSS